MSYLFSRKMRNIKKSIEEEVVLRMLREFLDEKEPELVYFLTNTWHSQGRAITYKQLREAIVAGYLTEDILEDWRQDYTRFVVEHLRPAWLLAMAEANKRLEEKYPEWYFDPFADGVVAWTTERAASFVTEVTMTQIEGLRAVIQRAAVLEDMSVDELARAIRPMVGLTHPQAVANMKYYENLIANGVSEKKALDLSTRYAARQHRYRGYNIARTELAFSYNQGSLEGIKQAQEKGYMGDVMKIWCTAEDERVCPICRGLEGKRILLDEDFEFNTRLDTSANPTIKKVPPAHPSCRCAVMYKTIPMKNTITEITPTKTRRRAE